MLDDDTCRNNVSKRVQVSCELNEQIPRRNRRDSNGFGCGQSQIEMTNDELHAQGNRQAEMQCRERWQVKQDRPNDRL